MSKSKRKTIDPSRRQILKLAAAIPASAIVSQVGLPGVLASLADSPGVVGPMLGSVTPTEAAIWLATEQPRQVSIEYRPETPSADQTATFRCSPSADPHNIVTARLTNLAPSTTYRYEAVVDGQRNPAWQAQFATAPPLGKPVRFTAAVSSCMKVADNPSQPAWSVMLADKPDVQLLLGDNVYADSTDAEVLWDHHRRQRQVPEFAQLVRNVPTYAVWDDHDFGVTNSDGNQPGKETSLAVFKSLFPNPAYGTDETPGVFFRFSWGDVDFFMLDVRYHRSPNRAPNDDTKRMLGDGQFAWLEQALRTSQARFKVLASGSPLAAMPPDGWNLYDFERKRMFDIVAKHKIGGVIFVSGEIHRCQLAIHPAERYTPYPLYEVISSGIANSREQGFATLEFDTTLADPTLRIRMRRKDGSTPLDQTVKLSELQT